MNELHLFTKLNSLPLNLKEEVGDFIDFLLSKKQNSVVKKQPVFGIAKGQFTVSQDFDEPLDDFKEYME